MYRKSVNLRILFLLTLFPAVGTFAQQDSVFVETQSDDHESYYNLKYESLDLFLRDETRLFKFAVSPFKPSERYNFGVILSQLAYEHKFNNAWSGVAELNQEFTLLESGNLFINSFDLGVRNYFLKAKQIRKGLSGNNCNGLYAGAKISNILVGTNFLNDGIENTYVSFEPKPELNFGIQQRISSLFYVDASAFINYNLWTEQSGLGYGIRVLIGLAINVGE
ncbi:MAG: hypothetical protein ACK5KP_07450 [Paludibacteraceae bacterium]